MAKKSKKINAPKWLKSKYFLFVVALVVAIASVAGYKTFAAGPYIPTPCLGGHIQKGSTGSCVLAAKKALNYICSNKDISTKNSTFDQKMYYRVYGFQSSAGIVSDGKIGRTTWNNLYHYDTQKGPNSLGCFERHLDNP